ncbi:MAG: glycosyltransferase [Thermoanaerobaculia bacterium]
MGDQGQRLAILSQDLSQPGNGVRSVVIFLHRVAIEAGFEVDLLSAATSSRDPASLRLLAPSTWLSGPQMVECEDPLLPAYRHSGASFTELEFRRYRPRRELTRRLDDCALVQVVAGTPAWANLARDARAPVALQLASTARVERASALAAQRGLRRLWSAAMTTATASLERRALARSSLVLVENRAMAARLASTGAAGRIRLAPPGTDTERFRPAEAAGPGYWLSVARFADPRKNVQLLFRGYAAAKALRGDLPKLVLAGSSDPSPRDLEVAAELGIAADLDLRGGVPEETLPALYRGASLFLLSSNEEGWGLVLVEAMASGLPVVATRSDGAAEIVREGETGHLVPIGDAEALAARSLALHAHPEVARRMGAAARRVAEEELSLVVCGRRFVEAWRDLARPGPPPGRRQ